MNNARDELAKVITIGPECFTNGEVICYKGENYTRQPRTVSTVAELDALPVGSVVRTSGDNPRVAVKDGVWKTESEWFVADADEWCLDSSELDDLPASVLYEPEGK